MRINHPVIDHELFLQPGAIVVTRSDLEGKITYANDVFMEISGFSQEELIGSDHNIIRHPDMPPAVFEDLWKTLKSGRPWTGVVKNRAKSGAYYWVEANISPVFEKGRLQGYMSVRSAASREQINAATQLYEQIRNHKAQFRAVGWLDKLNIGQRLSIGKKIGLLGIMLILPSLILMKMLVDEKDVNIKYTEQEIKGLEYITPLKKVLVHIAEHRSLTDSYLHGVTSKNDTEIEGIHKAVADEFKTVDAADAVYGEEFKSTEKWQKIKHDWSLLEQKSLQLVPEDNYIRHNHIIEEATELLNNVSNKSNLMLDPEANTHYLMMIVTVLLPELIDSLNDFRTTNIYNAKNAGELPEKNKIQIAIFDQSIRNRSMKIVNNLGDIYEINDTLKPVLQDKQTDFAMKTIGFLQLIKREISTAKVITVTPEQIAQQGTEALSSVDSLNQAVIASLKSSLDERKSRLINAKYIIVTVVAFSLILVSFIAYRNIRTITGTLKHIIKIFSRIGEGEFKNIIDLNRHDELGDLLRGLYSMQVSLNGNISETREQVIKTTRVQRALDNASSAVMLADNKFQVIYMNHAALTLFNEAEADICEQLMEFNPNKILGENIDRFHQKPEHQRSVLANLHSTFRSDLKIGPRHFHITVNPVIDAAGQRIGTVIEWMDRTLEVKIEQDIAEIVTAVKAGDLSTRIDLSDKQGFFEKLSIGINEFSNVIEKVFTDIASVMQSMESGDLTNIITDDFEGVYGDCKNNINATIANLSEVFMQIKDSAIFINESSQEIASGNSNLSQRAEDQATSLEQAAASMDELTSTVKNNADNAQQANQVARSAQEMAEQSGTVIASAINAMVEISESSNEIADIISVIDEIAFQTNLLALNASVEAARAGEHGRGFSIVATEVRNLAQRSAAAAYKSKLLLQDSIQKVHLGTKFVNETGKSLADIVTGVKEVSAIMTEIASASEQQTAGIIQVNQMVMQLDQITQQNATLAEQAATASASMNDQTTHMANLLAFFKINHSSATNIKPPL